MANSHTEIYIQIVFAVKYRENLIRKEHREELHKFITGIVTNRGQKLLSVFCMPDHTHVFVRIRPDITISDLVGDIKAGSSKFITEKGWVKKFNWQNGYGAFSYSTSAVYNVCKYIANQEEHHAKDSFKKEYVDLLKEFEIEYDEKYLFEWIE